MDAAPFFDAIADGPDAARAVWLNTADGLRIRAVHWRTGGHGTVLLFTGRTEYIEKYGRAARELARRGYDTLTFDWRGQGLSDRMLADRDVGHVFEFSDYQHDVGAVLKAAEALGAARPLFLLAHSMGGCIGLRSLIDGLEVRSAMFSAPMWGIKIAPAARPLAQFVASLSRKLGFDHAVTPTTGGTTYALAQPFEGNLLTSDPEMYAWLSAQLRAHPELALSGPSLRWLDEALAETKALAALPSPAHPCETFLGSEEGIVDIAAIRTRMAAWPGGHLTEIDGARHEIPIEVPEVRTRFFDAAARLFERTGDVAA